MASEEEGSALSTWIHFYPINGSEINEFRSHDDA